MDFENSRAFRAMAVDLAVVTGKRRESGAARDLGPFALRCCLLVGDVADEGGNPMAPGAARQATVVIAAEDWPDHAEPQAGDAYAFDGRGVFKSAQFHRDPDGWTLEGIFVYDGVRRV